MTEKKKQIITSLRVNADSWKEAKIEAIKHDLTLTEVIEDALKDWVKKKQEENI